MNQVLITGGTGLVGSNLGELLLKEGYKVRILRRPNSDLRSLRNLNVEHFLGDVTDKPSIIKAMRNCDTVFHTAAIVAMWKGKKEEQIQVNILGTRNVADAALELGINKFIHTSSIAALGYRTDGELSDENTPFNWPESLGYKNSKHLAELEILKAIDKGLPAIIVNPSVIIGPKDYRFHGGKMIRDIKRGIIPFYIDGGLNVAFVNDIVHGHIQAAKLGRIGERYVLGGENLTIKEAFEKVANTIGGRAPKIKAPAKLVNFIATIFDSMSSVTGKQPWISTDLIASIGINFWFSSNKAIQELEYKITPFETAVSKTYEWYKAEGLIR